MKTTTLIDNSVMDAFRNGAQRFLIVDDESVTIMICRHVIRRLFPNAGVISFTRPDEALEFIRQEYAVGGNMDTLMLLDLNMPMLSGWDVLEQVDTLPAEIKSQFNIYILTSSVSTQDKQRAMDNSLVYGFFIKPLTDAQVESMFLVKKYKNSFLNPVPHTPGRKRIFLIPDEDRRILDKILPYFELSENANISKAIRAAYHDDAVTLNNMPINLFAERIGTFLMLNGFANNLSGIPVINKNGIALKAAGSLAAFEKGMNG